MIGTVGLILAIAGVVQWKRNRGGAGWLVLTGIVLMAYDIWKTYPGKSTS